MEKSTLFYPSEGLLGNYLILTDGFGNFGNFKLPKSAIFCENYISQYKKIGFVDFLLTQVQAYFVA